MACKLWLCRLAQPHSMYSEGCGNVLVGSSCNVLDLCGVNVDESNGKNTHRKIYNGAESCEVDALASANLKSV